ncbi:hypothetical protein HDU80_007884 [Chytriomyces hyalinus]|nr:hypothetical protein HDU80_007884 [Chytriomyces hyalinus]
MNNLFQSLEGKVREGVGKIAAVVQRQDSNSDSVSSAGGYLKDLTLGDYTLKPLDAVLFAGNDPVATFIKRITLHEVVPRIDRPFHELWTHAGILVDKTVLPLPFLEDGKMYLYESVFSGTVVGYTYSKVLPVDKNVPPGGCHLGPQIRDFEAVVDEGTVNVGICPLTSEQRRIVEEKFKENPNFLMEIYEQYKEFGYPLTNLLSVVASASDNLRDELDKFGQFAKKTFGAVGPVKKTVFCSEFISIIYKQVGLKTFTDNLPETFTPLEVEVAPEFGNRVYYAKEDGVSLMKHNKVKTGSFTTQAQKLIKSYAMSANWVQMKPGGGVPPGANAAGEDIDGKPLYIARVKIGSAYYLGKIRSDWTYPLVTYFDREVPINFGHEVLANLEDMKWVPGKGGEIPPKAVKAGMDDDGHYLYVARAVVGDSRGVLGIGKKSGAYAPGTVAPHLKSARIPFGGKEVREEIYDVLCHD